MSWNGYENNVLLRNEGTGADGVPRFVDVGMALGADDIGDSRGVAVADFDHDGDLDLAINHNPGDHGADGVPVALLRNDLGSRRGWLAVELEGTASNRDGVGALVRLEPAGGGDAQVRLATAGSGYASQHGSRLYFGLGDQPAAAYELEVRWPSGRVDRFGDVLPRRLARVTEGGGLEQTPLPGSAAPPAVAGVDDAPAAGVVLGATPSAPAAAR